MHSYYNRWCVSRAWWRWCSCTHPVLPPDHEDRSQSLEAEASASEAISLQKIIGTPLRDNLFTHRVWNRRLFYSNPNAAITHP